MTDFQKFKKAYNLIILESLSAQIKSNKNPGVSFKNSLYSPKTKQQFLNSYKNIYWIFDNKQQNLLYTQSVIIQSPGSIDYPGTLCDEILKIKRFGILKNDEVLNLIHHDWKYFKQLKQYGLPIKIIKFDFSNQKQILNAFKLIYENDELNEMILEDFSKNENANGAQLIFNDICILLFNSKNYSKKTILHQFTHYLQHLLNVQKIEIKQDLDVSKLNFLNLSKINLENLIGILKDQNQIIPYVNQFCQNIYEVFKQYQKLDKTLKWTSMFSQYFLKIILNSENLNEQKLFKIYKKVSNNDLFPLYVVIGCYIYNIQWQKIKRIILENDKFE